MLWIGERTRELDGAHVNFCESPQPSGCKMGPTSSPDDVLALCEALSRTNSGRLTLISRMGAERVGDTLPSILRKVTDAGHPVVWECDPMHGNT